MNIFVFFVKAWKVFLPTFLSFSFVVYVANIEDQCVVAEAVAAAMFLVGIPSFFISMFFSLREISRLNGFGRASNYVFYLFILINLMIYFLPFINPGAFCIL